MSDFKTIGELVGKTINKIEHSPMEVVIETDDGSRWRMFHNQDCCESVTLEKVEGNLAVLMDGGAVISAREEFNDEPPLKLDYKPESATYTDFVLETKSGIVKFRWMGESNGYYSEEVLFQKLS